MMVLLLMFGGALVNGLLVPLGWVDVVAAVVILLVVRPWRGLSASLVTRPPYRSGSRCRSSASGGLERFTTWPTA